MTNQFYGPTTVEEAAAALNTAAEAFKVAVGETVATLEVSSGTFIVIATAAEADDLKAPLPAGGGGRDSTYEV